MILEYMNKLIEELNTIRAHIAEHGFYEYGVIPDFEDGNYTVFIKDADGNKKWFNIWENSTYMPEISLNNVLYIHKSRMIDVLRYDVEGEYLDSDTGYNNDDRFECLSKKFKEYCVERKNRVFTGFED